MTMRRLSIFAGLLVMLAASTEAWAVMFQGGGSYAPIASPSITNIALAPQTFPAGTAGTVGTATATLSSGSFTGTWDLQTSGTATNPSGTTCTNNPVFSIN